MRSSAGPKPVSFSGGTTREPAGGPDNGTDADVDATLSPAVLRLAAHQQVPLETVQSLDGSGRGGRVTKRDLETWLGQRRTDRSDQPVGPRTSSSAMGPMQPPDDYLYEPTPRDNRVPMSSTRRRIAEHMHWSARIASHATTIDEVDMSVAVAVPETDELLVPVINDADQLDLPAFARRLHDLVTRARSRRVSPAELRGGTFTYSNPGVAGTPMFNQPQSAILGSYAIRDQPWVVDGAVTVRPIMGMSVAFDHRMIGGLMGFQFLTRMRAQLESAEAL